jgi:phage N-6-adenine-methyltransferase
MSAPANDNKPTTYRTAFSGDNEWYTPSRYIEMARDVMGGIDVDPASNDVAQATVRAGTFYTAETDGLSKDWYGTVWMNPPYAQPLISKFCMKLLAEVAEERTTQAIVLTNNSTDTRWFASLCGAASATCFTLRRIRFESPTRGTASPTQGQTFFYFGRQADRFQSVFQDIGHVMVMRRANNDNRGAEAA